MADTKISRQLAMFDKGKKCQSFGDTRRASSLLSD